MGDNSKNNVVDITADEMKDAPHTSVTKAAIKGECRDVGGVGGKRIRSVMDRIQRLEEEKQALGVDIKEVYAEAKGIGLCTKTIRKLIALEKMDAEKRNEADEMLDLYKTAIGMH